MERMRVGDPLDKCIDMGAIVDQTQWDTIDGWVKRGVQEGGCLFQPDIELTEGSHFGYALQWFTFASILFIGYPFYLRKQEIK